MLRTEGAKNASSARSILSMTASSEGQTRRTWRGAITSSGVGRAVRMESEKQDAEFNVVAFDYGIKYNILRHGRVP